jgi:hypothetical protein
MARLGTAERAVFDAVRRSCYRGLVSAELRAAASQRLGEYLRADAYCGMELDPSITLPVHAVSDGWPPEAHEPLLVHAVLASPTADPPRLLASGRRAVDVDELLGARRRDGDPYFTHHILPFGYRWEVQLLCAAHGTGRAFFTFNRTAAHGAFEPRQLRLLEICLLDSRDKLSDTTACCGHVCLRLLRGSRFTATHARRCGAMTQQLAYRFQRTRNSPPSAGPAHRRVENVCVDAEFSVTVPRSSACYSSAAASSAA